MYFKSHEVKYTPLFLNSNKGNFTQDQTVLIKLHKKNHRLIKRSPISKKGL